MLIALVSLAYVIAVNFIQNNIGGKGRMRSLQKEMTEVQKKMLEAAKKPGNDAEYGQCTEKYNKLTFELVGIQLQLTVILLLFYFPIVAFVFPSLEPGSQDDARIHVFDDGLDTHCDAKALDGIYSNCYALPANGVKGAWVVGAYLNSSKGDLLSRQDTAIYYEGGTPEDVWLQSVSQSGLLDGLENKKPYILNASTDKLDYKAGEAVQVFVRPFQVISKTGNSLNDIVNSLRNNGIVPSANETAEISGFSESGRRESLLSVGGKQYLFRKSPVLFGEDMLVGNSSVPQGASLTAVFNSGTFFHVDLPFALPLLNIRRIIGSSGTFIFFAFIMGIIYSMIRSAYARVSKKQ